MPSIIYQVGQQGGRVPRSYLGAYNVGIRGKPDEAELGQGASSPGMPASLQPPPSRSMKLMVGPRQGEKDIQVQQYKIRNSLPHQ